MLFQWLGQVIFKRWFLICLLLINLAGSIYGFYWYGNQLKETPAHFLIFVPDSPTASSFFTLFLFLYLIGRQNLYVEAFAAITSFKYGVWAVAVIIAGAWINQPSVEAMLQMKTLTWTDVMLMFSHASMAVEALLYFRVYRIHWRAIAVTGAWTIVNDYIDYIWGMHPWLPYSLAAKENVIGMMTFELSLISIMLVAVLMLVARNQPRAVKR